MEIEILEPQNLSMDTAVPKESAEAKVFQEAKNESGNVPSSPSNATRHPNFSRYVCSVCEDHATGSHFGALVCNGCRSFFRRSMMKENQYYFCKKDGNCTITVKHRNCKACRFDTCIKVGMQMKAKDVRINMDTDDGDCDMEVKRSRMDLSAAEVDNGVVIRSTQTLSFSSLLESYYGSNQEVKSSIEIPQVDETTISSDWSAFVKSDHLATHSQLLMMVQWAKRIQGFGDLLVEDRVALLRSFSAKHLCLHVTLQTIRSPENYEKSNFVSGWGKVVIPIQAKELENFMEPKHLTEIRNAFKEIFRRFMKPLKEAEITDEEFICFAAMLLLDPNVEGLSEPKKVMALRRNIQSIVMEEGKGMNPTFPYRIMDLLNLIPIFDTVVPMAVASTRDSNYYDPVGKRSRLMDEIYFGICD